MKDNYKYQRASRNAGNWHSAKRLTWKKKQKKCIPSGHVICGRIHVPVRGTKIWRVPGFGIFNWTGVPRRPCDAVRPEASLRARWGPLVKPFEEKGNMGSSYGDRRSRLKIYTSPLNLLRLTGCFHTVSVQQEEIQGEILLHPHRQNIGWLSTEDFFLLQKEHNMFKKE